MNYGPIHTNSNVICAIDIRVGGIDPIQSDILEVCFLPLNHSYRPHPTITPFNIRMRPSFLVDLKIAKIGRPELSEFEGSMFDQITGCELFERWWENIRHQENKLIMPLVWNWTYIKPWLDNWLGSTYHHYIHDSYREMMSLLNFMNDRADFHGDEPPYKQPTLAQLFCRSDVKLIDRNSLIANCKGYSDVYRYLLLHK